MKKEISNVCLQVQIIWTDPNQFGPFLNQFGPIERKVVCILTGFSLILDGNQNFWTIIRNLDHSASREDRSLVSSNSLMNDDDKINQV